ncbi:MAG: hypothetical protein Q9190_005581 [Brigantiaea leucoxantha]
MLYLTTVSSSESQIDWHDIPWDDVHYNESATLDSLYDDPITPQNLALVSNSADFCILKSVLKPWPRHFSHSTYRYILSDYPPTEPENVPYLSFSTPGQTGTVRNTRTITDRLAIWEAQINSLRDGVAIQLEKEVTGVKMSVTSRWFGVDTKRLCVTALHAVTNLYGKFMAQGWTIDVKFPHSYSGEMRIVVEILSGRVTEPSEVS